MLVARLRARRLAMRREARSDELRLLLRYKGGRLVDIDQGPDLNGQDVDDLRALVDEKKSFDRLTIVRRR